MEELIKEMEKLGYEVDYLNNEILFFKKTIYIKKEYSKVLLSITKHFVEKRIDDEPFQIFSEELEIIYKIMKLLRGDK